LASLIVNTPEPMARMKILAIKDDRDKILNILHKAGVLHVDVCEDLSPVDRHTLEEEKSRITSLLSKVNELWSRTKKAERDEAADNIEIIYTGPIEQLDAEVNEVYTKLSNLYLRTATRSDELSKLEELTCLEPLSQTTGLDTKDMSYTGKYLFSRTILLSAEKYNKSLDRLEELFIEKETCQTGDKIVVYGVGKTEDLQGLNAFVVEAEGKLLDVPETDGMLGDFIKESASKKSSLREEIETLQNSLDSAMKENAGKISSLRQVLLAQQDKLLVLEKTAEANYVVLISGWVPENSAETAIIELNDAMDNIFVNTSKPGPGDAPPSKLKNKGLFRPFEVITNLFGTPGYNEWDPTPVLAYSFAVFFGIMVCDVIYAIGIALLGLFLLPKFAEDPKSKSFKTFQQLIFLCSGVALVAGLLTGQYMGNINTLFGIPDLALNQQVKNALQNPISFIVIALAIGFIHVNTAHVLALIKSIKQHNGWQIVNKAGLFALQFGIPGILHSMLHVNIPGFTAETYSALSYVMFSGVGLIIISSLASSGALGAISWLFDVTGLLGDVMSYARLAGVGLATYYLASTFNMLSACSGV
jgi:V/A-type H+-transporting ATPase subunit I